MEINSRNFDRKVISYIRILHTIYAVVGMIILIDFFGAVAWILSGQTPDGNFYIGTITIHLLRLVIR